jgi:hypothetical protein
MKLRPKPSSAVIRGEIRAKMSCVLSSVNSPILDGYEIFHNHVRPCLGLDGRTLAELAGIKVEGENKLLTIIQNARLQKVVTDKK